MLRPAVTFNDLNNAGSLGSEAVLERRHQAMLLTHMR